MYDSATGGCCDGLSPDGVSLNQGAESTLAFLQSLAELRLLEQAWPPTIAAPADFAEGVAGHFPGSRAFVATAGEVQASLQE